VAGDDLKALFLAHGQDLQAYLTRRLRDPEAAADLTQQTFVRFAERLLGATVLNARPYLYRTAHNLAVDHLRRIARSRTDVVASEELALIPEDAQEREDVIEARQRLDLLRGAIAELPERTRRIFVLHRLEELTYAEIAQRLGISESSVQKHLAKALRHVMRRVHGR
jgi:RNA polymerase sigma-70 factor (ECF subfamily)